MSLGLPGRRRHGDLQGRVPPPALPRAAAPGVALLDGLAAAVAARRRADAAAGELPCAPRGSAEAAGRDRARTLVTGVRRRAVHPGSLGPAPMGVGGAAGGAVAGL